MRRRPPRSARVVQGSSHRYSPHIEPPPLARTFSQATIYYLYIQIPLSFSFLFSLILFLRDLRNELKSNSTNRNRPSTSAAEEYKKKKEQQQQSTSKITNDKYYRKKKEEVKNLKRSSLFRGE